MRGDSLLTDEQLRECQQLVRAKVERFLRGPRRRNDADDLSADVMTRILAQLPKHNPSRASLKTFINRIADSALLDNHRHRWARKRDHRRNARSLNETVYNSDGRACEFSQLIDAEQQAVLGRRRRSQQELTELALNLRETICHLTPRDRQFLQQLLGTSAPEAACDMHVTRGTVYRRLRGIRKQLESSALREYLD